MCRATVAIAYICCHLLTTCLSAGEVTILRDEFDTLPSGPLSKVLWARAEYHFLPESGPKGPWNITAYTSTIGSQRAWQVIEHEGRKALLQTYTPQSEKHIHPMVTAGDPLWENYQVAVRFTPQSSQRQCGVLFRLRNDRQGWGSELRFRAVACFPVNSGVYVGKTDGYGVVDIGGTYRPPVGARNLMFAVNVTNLLNHGYATFVGVPHLGRLVLTKISYTF